MSSSADYTLKEQRELSALAGVHKLPPDQLVGVTMKQLSVASKIPLGSVAYKLASLGVKSVFTGVYRAEDISRFIKFGAVSEGVSLAFRVARANRGTTEKQLAAAAHIAAVSANKRLLAQEEGK